MVLEHIFRSYDVELQQLKIFLHQIRAYQEDEELKSVSIYASPLTHVHKVHKPCRIGSLSGRVYPNAQCISRETFVQVSIAILGFTSMLALFGVVRDVKVWIQGGDFGGELSIRKGPFGRNGSTGAVKIGIPAAAVYEESV